MSREKRILGTETIIFVDGEEKEVTFHAVPNFMILRLRTKNRTQRGDQITFNDDNFFVQVLKQSTGNQISDEDWENGIESDITELYRKYFNPSKEEVNKKKDKLSDTSNQNQDQ